MTVHLLKDLDRLRQDILRMGGMVEEAIGKAIRALVDRDVGLAEEVITGEERINELELEIGEEALKVLALHQPVASDLRFTVAVMQVNNDLERMADLAENMARRTRTLVSLPPIRIPFDIVAMATRVREMVKKSLDSMVEQDVDGARSVIKMDDQVDDAHREVYRTIQTFIRENPDLMEQAIQLLSVSRQLERIADHTTNIAEDVVFMVEGDVIRHQEASD